MGYTEDMQRFSNYMCNRSTKTEKEQDFHGSNRGIIVVGYCLRYLAQFPQRTLNGQWQYEMTQVGTKNIHKKKTEREMRKERKKKTHQTKAHSIQILPLIRAINMHK